MIRFTALKVTLHFRSGRDLSFLAEEVTKTFSGNELDGLKATGAIRWPFYFRLADVEAVTHRRVLKLRWLS